MTTTTEQLAAALRACLPHVQPDALDPEGAAQDEATLAAAREALARYDAERAEYAEPDAADSAQSIAQAYLGAVLEQGEFIVTDGPVIIEDADDDDARNYAVPVLIRVSADDVEPGQVDDDTRSNGPRR